MPKILSSGYHGLFSVFSFFLSYALTSSSWTLRPFTFLNIASNHSFHSLNGDASAMLFVLMCALLFTTWLSEGPLQQSTIYSFYQESCLPPSTYGVTIKILQCLCLKVTVSESNRKEARTSVQFNWCCELHQLIHQHTLGTHLWRVRILWVSEQRQCYKRPGKGPWLSFSWATFVHKP